MLYVSSSLTLTTKKNKKMTSMSSGLTTLHVICQKMLGLWPIINSMSLLNLEAEANREPSAGGHQGPVIPAKHRMGSPFHAGHTAATLKCCISLAPITVVAILPDKDSPPLESLWAQWQPLWRPLETTLQS